MAHKKTINLPNKNGSEHSGEYEPACRLVSLFTASGDDAVDGEMLHQAGIIYSRTLDDITNGKAEIQDALFVTSNEHFTAGAVGPAGLDSALSLLAALSLSYDWVFVVPKAGCEAAHVRLGSASDVSLISYSAQGDNFMRAFWMIDALRRRTPHFDPLILSTGEKSDAVETAFMLSETVREHLGAPPPYAGHLDDLHLETRLLKQMRVQAARRAAA